MSDIRRLLSPERPLAPVQWAAIAGSLVVLSWSVPGLIATRTSRPATRPPRSSSSAST